MEQAIKTYNQWLDSDCPTTESSRVNYKSLKAFKHFIKSNVKVVSNTCSINELTSRLTSYTGGKGWLLTTDKLTTLIPFERLTDNFVLEGELVNDASSIQFKHISNGQYLVTEIKEDDSAPSSFYQEQKFVGQTGIANHLTYHIYWHHNEEQGWAPFARRLVDLEGVK